MLVVHYKTVRELIASGTLRAGKIGWSYLILTKDLERYLEIRASLKETPRGRRSVHGFRDALAQTMRQHWGREANPPPPLRPLQPVPRRKRIG